MGGSPPTVLILGAGINGCALARELVLNGVSVWLVDSDDIACGATGGSSHLIHGGLRYLEYGEFDLVKESLAERARLLRLAPQYIRPLKLWIPTSNRLGGSVGAVGRFFGWNWWPAPLPTAGRGAWLIRAGLALYDAYARDPALPKHQTWTVPAQHGPPVNRQKYRWLSSYYDAQVEFPERLAMALLHDAAGIAEQSGLDFRVFTYCQTVLYGKLAEISANPGTELQSAEHTLEPAMIVNATGAWVDETLKRLCVPSERLMGGTKGSHLFTFNPRLRALLGEDGIYAEAADGRPIFITPLAGTVLIGTTDQRFEGPPEDAALTERERDYLLEAVNAILPDAGLTPDDVAFHYSAVRPLPYVDARTNAAITRRHAIVRNDTAAVPMISLVGGKLTTMRSLAELAAAEVLKTLGRSPSANSEDRGFAGAHEFVKDAGDLSRECGQIAARVGYPPASVSAVIRLVGIPPDDAFRDAGDEPAHQPTLLADTNLPTSIVRRVIRDEWVTTLADLVERRLMLLYHQRLTYACLHELADLLGRQEGRISRDSADREQAVNDEVARLKARYGKRVE